MCLTSKAQDVRRGKTVLGVNCFWATVSHQWRKSAEFKRRTGCVCPADPGWRAGEDAWGTKTPWEEERAGWKPQAGLRKSLRKLWEGLQFLRHSCLQGGELWSVTWTQWLGSSGRVALPGLGAFSFFSLLDGSFLGKPADASWRHEAPWSLCGQQVRSPKSLLAQPDLRMTAETRPPQPSCPAWGAWLPPSTPRITHTHRRALGEQDLKSRGSPCASPSLAHSPPHGGGWRSMGVDWWVNTTGSLPGPWHRKSLCLELGELWRAGGPCVRAVPVDEQVRAAWIGVLSAGGVWAGTERLNSPQKHWTHYEHVTPLHTVTIRGEWEHFIYTLLANFKWCKYGIIHISHHVVHSVSRTHSSCVTAALFPSANVSPRPSPHPPSPWQPAFYLCLCAVDFSRSHV